MIFVIMGAPGAGKGTQCELLAEKIGALKISTGDVLRKHIQEGTGLGLQIRDLMESGRLVSDDILLAVVDQELERAGKRHVLLDGFPRTLKQAEALADHPVSGVYHIDVSEADLIERLVGRLVCAHCGSTYHSKNRPPKQAGICDRCGEGLSTRADDERAKVQVRLSVYEEQTKPVFEFYQDLGLYHRIDGSRAPSLVLSDLEQQISAKIAAG